MSGSRVRRDGGAARRNPRDTSSGQPSTNATAATESMPHQPGQPAAPIGPIRAVVDTSSLVPARLRHDLQQAAQLGASIRLWSPWIIAELNRVLTWRWIKVPLPGVSRADLSASNERRCSEAAKLMMEWLLPSFALVNPLPPYPPAWETLTDTWDLPIWAAAKLGRARYIISENTRDYPPRDAQGRAAYDGIEYLSGTTFLALLTGPLE